MSTTNDRPYQPYPVEPERFQDPAADAYTAPSIGPGEPVMPAGDPAAALAAAPPADGRLALDGSSVWLNRLGEELVAWFKTLASAAVYATLIVTFGFQVARVEGQSMAPTLHDQDGDECRLREDHQHGSGDVITILLPDRNRLVAHDAAGWQQALPDMPPLKGPPVEHRHGVRSHFERQ